jgi:hypothetical protein
VGGDGVGTSPLSVLSVLPFAGTARNVERRTPIHEQYFVIIEMMPPNPAAPPRRDVGADARMESQDAGPLIR